MVLRNYKSVPVGELVKYSANSRTHSDEQIAKIVRSINEFGFSNPLLIDENNVIIAGHGRLAAAIEAGIDELPCIVLDGLTDAQKAALVIADNKIALDAGWDRDILLSQFDFLKQFDYDLTLTGFDLEELCEILPDEVPEVFCGEDDLPSDEEIWLLGNHRLICGNIDDEIDSICIDVIIQQYQSYTGKDAVHEKSRKTWNQLNQEIKTESKAKSMPKNTTKKIKN